HRPRRAPRPGRRRRTRLLRPLVRRARRPGDAGDVRLCRRDLWRRRRAGADLRHPVSPGEVRRRRRGRAPPLPRALAFPLVPALDPFGGRFVGLLQVDYAATTAYDKPVEALVATAARSADGFHVVDLDGARDGATANAPLFVRLVALSPVP